MKKHSTVVHPLLSQRKEEEWKKERMRIHLLKVSNPLVSGKTQYRMNGYFAGK